jgi:hypothetical protein
MATPVAGFADCTRTTSSFIELKRLSRTPPYGGKLAGSDENTGWTRLTGRVTLANNMAISDAALFGAVVTIVLLCLALDRLKTLGWLSKGHSHTNSSM